jgi:hypothetical protein
MCLENDNLLGVCYNILVANQRGDKNSQKSFITLVFLHHPASETAVSTKVIVFTASMPSVYYLVLDNTFYPVGGAVPKPGKVKVQVYAKRF